MMGITVTQDNLPLIGTKVTGPASSTDNAVARFNSTSGGIIKNSGVIIDDSNNVTGVVIFTATGLVSGSNIAESSTSIRFGTSSAFHSTPTKGTIIGQGSSVINVNTTVVGYGNRAAQYSFVAGTDNFTSTTPPAGICLITREATATKTSGQNCIVIAPGSYTFANGYGGVYLGSFLNVTSSTPTNTANNSGVYIGESVTHTGGTYAGAVIIGRDNDGRNSLYCTLVGSAIVTATGLQNSVVVGYAASAIDAQPHATVIGPEAKAFLDSSYGSGGGHQVAVGYTTYAGSWRATALGSYAQALAVSTTVTGYGGYANKDHGSLSGRGGYNDVVGAHLIYTGGTTLGLIYIGATAAKWTNPAMPGTEAVDLSTGLNAGTTISKIYGISGRDADAVPSLTNTRGGHVRIIGGVSTGTALGGEVQLAASPVSGVSSNTENAEVVMIAIKGDYTFNYTDEVDNVYGTTTGTKHGTATTQKQAFWNATPIVQPTTGVAAATLVSNGGTTLTSTDTFDGYTLLQVVKALRNTGLLA